MPDSITDPQTVRLAESPPILRLDAARDAEVDDILLTFLGVSPGSDMVNHLHTWCVGTGLREAYERGQRAVQSDATRELVWSAAFASGRRQYSDERAWDLADVCVASYITEKRRREAVGSPVIGPSVETSDDSPDAGDPAGLNRDTALAELERPRS